jgi:hypothetical protein
MTYTQAVKLLSMQDRNIRKVNNTRFVQDGYEYRVTYRGGFASYVAIDRRRVGTRNFKYFGGVGAYNCWTVGDVMELVMHEVEKKA